MRRRQLPGEPPPPTKGELKRQARAVQELANRLIAAPEALVEGLDLPEKLHDAIALARRITAHGAALRQRQFVAKLMRGVDPAPIEAALATDAVAARQDAARFKRAERWRDRLIAEPAAREAFVAEFPDADRRELSRLLAAGAARELFRFVSQVLTRSQAPP